MYRLLAAAVLLPLSYSAPGQAAWYDIIMAGKVIGSVHVLPGHQSGEVFTRTIISSFHVPLLYSGNFESVNRRVNGALVEAETLHSAGGKMKEKTLTLPAAPGYRVAFYKSDPGNPAREERLNGIRHTLTDLYYAEPLQVSRAYSERYGAFCTIKPLSGSRYSVKLPTGKTSVYTYREGVCQQVELELAGIRLKIVKRGQQPGGFDSALSRAEERAAAEGSRP